MSRRILITGGAGFIGSHLCEKFLNEGHQVLCMDVDPEKIRILESGGIPIHEPGLDAVVARSRGQTTATSLPLSPATGR